MNATSQKSAILYGLATVLCWSTVATAFKLTLVYLSPTQLIVVATLVSSIFLLGVLAVQGRLNLLLTCTARQYAQSLLFGAMNPALYYGLLFYAYALLPAQEAQALNYSWAIVMSLLAVPMLGHRLNRFDCMAVLLCYTGVLIIATRGNLLTLEFANSQGVLLALASTLVWALYWILNRQDQRDPVLALCLNFLCVMPFILLFAWFSGELQTLLSVNWRAIVGAVYIGIFEMGLAFVLWLTAIKRAVNTSQVANLIFISPFLSLIFITLVLRETILLSTLMGLGLILFGLFVQQKFSKSV